MASQSITRTFNVAGTFTWQAPPDVTAVRVEAWGAGGGGAALSGSGGGGGGGGGYARTNALAVTPGNQYTVVVGAGGAANTAGTAQSSTFNSTSVIGAGGVGVSASTTGGGGGTSTTSVGADAETNGGNGSNGSTTGDIGGGGGGAAGSAGNGVTPSNASGGVGASGGAGANGSGGAGGGGGNGTNGTAGVSNVLAGGGGGGGDDTFRGANGGVPGGGGGGGEAGGGAGGNGQIVLNYSTEYVDLASVSSGIVTNAGTLTFSHTVPDLNDRILVVLVNRADAGNTATDPVTSVTFGGVALTNYAAASGNTNDENWISVWYLIAPTVQTANIGIGIAASSATLTAHAGTFVNVEQSGNPEAGNKADIQNAEDKTVTVTTVTDNAVVVGMCNTTVDAITGIGAGQAQIASTDSDFAVSSWERQAALGNCVHSYVNAQTDDGIVVGIALKQVSAAVGGRLPRFRMWSGMGI